MSEMIYCHICREFFECYGYDSCVCPNHEKKESKILDSVIKELIKKGILNESSAKND